LACRIFGWFFISKRGFAEISVLPSGGFQGIILGGLAGLRTAHEGLNGVVRPARLAQVDFPKNQSNFAQTAC
jgi:hypothetical protein